jgi:hypothetical protein
VLVVVGGFDVVVCVVVDCVGRRGREGARTNVVVVGTGGASSTGRRDVGVTVVVVVGGVSDARRQASIETLRHARRMERLHGALPGRAELATVLL